MNRKIQVGVLLTAVVAVVAFLFVKSADNGMQQYATAEKFVRIVNERNTNLDSAVLSLRLGLSRNYDELARCEQELAFANLAAEVPTDSTAWMNRLQSLQPLVEQKGLLATDFKASHSVVQNSIAGFEHYISEAQHDEEFAARFAIKLGQLEMLGSRYLVSGDGADKICLEKAIHELQAEAGSDPPGRALEMALKHARKLVEHRVELDNTVSKLVSIPVHQSTSRILDEAAAYHASRISTANWFRLGLTIATIALIAFCLYLFVALYKNRAALHESNSTLEQRVIERTAALAATNIELKMAIANAEKLALVARYTDNAVVISDARSSIEWVNDGFTRMTGYEPHEVVGRKPSDFLHGPGTEKEKLEIMRFAIDAKQGYDIETVYYRKNGEPFWVEVEARPITDHCGNVNRFISIENDITERVNAEFERQRLNEQLMDASRNAGMAEVATGVLHNVGNILNSVNVSTTVIRKQFEQSALSRLEKITELVAGHEGDFSGFVANDSRGKKIPAYLSTVTEVMQQERQKVIEEFQDLIDNVEHIKDIVSVQQSMAKSSGLRQELDPRGLVNDCITANKGTLANHHVKISQTVEESLPALVADKHKILQILINLVKNAKDAMVEQETADPEIRIDVRSSNGHVLFEVADNGIGIPEDKIDKIFNHGFTTKKTGHGFGLHSSANAATEMGGTLTVVSDGEGQGATFQLRLPAGVRGREPALAANDTLTTPIPH